MSYLGLVLITLVIGLGVNAYVNSSLNRNRKVASSTGLTGSQMARRMLDSYGLYDVPVTVGGHGQDFYNPKTNSITLSPSAFHESSVTAIATACHEAGHACQHAQGYTPIKVRTAVVPAVNFASNAWVFLLIFGIIMHMTNLVLIAVIVYAVVVAFQFITLPVEFNASSRATNYLQSIAVLSDEQQKVKSVLTACALTYVAAALTSVLQLLWLLGQARD